MSLLLIALLGLAWPVPSRPDARMPDAAPARPAAVRWGASGHRVIARIAENRLSPRTKAAVAKLLGEASLPSIASWADEVRSSRPATATWHYVNIPVIDSVYRPAKVCPKNCIIKVIDSLTGVLADPKRSATERGEALKFVVHFIGDLHQPLHAGDRGDRGGNDVRVRFLGRQINLHALWDSRLLDAMGISEDDLVMELLRRADRRTDLAALSAGTTVDWAMESHDIARDVVYRYLPNALVLGQGDLARARPVIEEALLRGGVRLAAVLEKALGK